jgi:hypothetical protein
MYTNFRVKSQVIRTKERLKEFIDNKLSSGFSLEVCGNPRMCEEYMTVEGIAVKPKYYSHCLWVGEMPAEEERRPKEVAVVETVTKPEVKEQKEDTMEVVEAPELLFGQKGMVLCFPGSFCSDLNSKLFH